MAGTWCISRATSLARGTEHGRHDPGAGHGQRRSSAGARRHGDGTPRRTFRASRDTVTSEQRRLRRCHACSPGTYKATCSSRADFRRVEQRSWRLAPRTGCLPLDVTFRIPEQVRGNDSASWGRRPTCCRMRRRRSHDELSTDAASVQLPTSRDLSARRCCSRPAVHQTGPAGGVSDRPDRSRARSVHDQRRCRWRTTCAVCRHDLYVEDAIQGPSVASSGRIRRSDGRSTGGVVNVVTKSGRQRLQRLAARHAAERQAAGAHAVRPGPQHRQGRPLTRTRGWTETVPTHRCTYWGPA